MHTYEPLTLAALQQKLPPHVDETIEGLGVFRLHRVPAIDLIRYQISASEMADNDGNIEDQDKIIGFMMGLVAKSLGGDFASPAGLAMLNSLDPDHQTQLIQRTMTVTRARAADRVEEIDAAKNE